MTAHPVDDHDPDDPVEILAVLPEGYHAQFLAEYTAAVEGALRPEQFRQLQELLRLWRLRAGAYSGPGYEERLAAARHGRAATHSLQWDSDRAQLVLGEIEQEGSPYAVDAKWTLRSYRAGKLNLD